MQGPGHHPQFYSTCIIWHYPIFLQVLLLLLKNCLACSANLAWKFVGDSVDRISSNMFIDTVPQTAAFRMFKVQNSEPSTVNRKQPPKYQTKTEDTVSRCTKNGIQLGSKYV